jgi:DNA-binding beta-propeller fold protein YncE
MDRRTILDVVKWYITFKLKKVISQIKVEQGPHGIRTSSDGTILYVAVTRTNEIIQINTKSLEITNILKTGNMPFWIAV